LQRVGEAGQAIAGIAVEYPEIDADPDHGTPAVEMGTRIDRALEDAQWRGGQGAGLDRRVGRTTRTAVAHLAAREVVGPEGEKPEGKRPEGRRRARRMFVLGWGPAAANASGGPPVAGVNMDHGDCCRGAATARGGTRWAFRRHAFPARPGTPFGVGFSLIDPLRRE
jgi:hypothetical protein